MLENGSRNAEMILYRTENLVTTRGIGKWFDKVYSSAHVGLKKPEQEFFAHILSDNPDFDKHEIVFWDDDMENIDGAKEFGFSTNLYTSFDDFVKKVKIV